MTAKPDRRWWPVAAGVVAAHAAALWLAWQAVGTAVQPPVPVLTGTLVSAAVQDTPPQPLPVAAKPVPQPPKPDPVPTQPDPAPPKPVVRETRPAQRRTAPAPQPVPAPPLMTSRADSAPDSVPPAAPATAAPPSPPQPVAREPEPSVASVPAPATRSAAPAAAAPAPAVVPPRSDAAHLNNPAPVYPPLSRKLQEQGRVLLDVHILADGSVGEMRLKKSSGFDRLDDAAMRAVRQWRYLPARRGDEPIAWWYVQPIVFALGG